MRSFWKCLRIYYGLWQMDNVEYSTFYVVKHKKIMKRKHSTYAVFYAVFVCFHFYCTSNKTRQLKERSKTIPPRSSGLGVSEKTEVSSQWILSYRSYLNRFVSVTNVIPKTVGYVGGLTSNFWDQIAVDCVRKKKNIFLSLSFVHFG